MSTRVPSITLVLLAVPIATLGLPATVVHADTIYVCWDGSGDYRTIQEGIDAAGDGDEVVVCDGTYTGAGNKDLDFHGKAITVRSENGPDNCIIDCQADEFDLHRGFHFHSGETPLSLVEGLTITNGYAGDGGGIYCTEGSGPTISNCVVTNNTAHDPMEGGRGGGICCRYESNATISECTITGNDSSIDGGGVYCGEASNATVINCTISENRAVDNGGGLCCRCSAPMITGCTVAANTASREHGGRGGGIGCYESAPTINDCTIVGNAAADLGGGVYCDEGSDATIGDCAIGSNTAGSAGGGVACRNSTATIAGSTISDNSGADAGGVYAFYGCLTVTDSEILGNNSAGFYCGGITIIGGAARIEKCTIKGNEGSPGSWWGGGVCCRGSNTRISDCVISENVVGYGGGLMFMLDDDSVIRNCLIIGNQSEAAGGGVHCEDSSPTISNCTITANTAGSGGGLSCWTSSSPVVANCTITGNTASIGGGVHCVESSPTMRNCTVSANTAHYGISGGVYCYYSHPRITNCVLWDDKPEEIRLGGGSDLIVSYSDVQGGWPGAGNIDADPLFVDPDGPDDDPNTWEDNDFHLSAGSPCIDAGCNWAVPPDTADLDEDGDTSEYTPLDLDGEGRFFDDPDTGDTGCGCPPIVDMGAYEFGDAGPQPCPGDLDCDRVVGHSDLGIFLRAWHISDEGDLNCDGETDHADLGILLTYWGAGCP
ncbi:MAG TPA: right-handed parallel beta-helix repeat-containing protein [Phycisphaerae bacterium]|nr:right-handed parallel beta-helix repeat-containing protein [Phycisphaerae bacterium]